MSAKPSLSKEQAVRHAVGMFNAMGPEKAKAHVDRVFASVRGVVQHPIFGRPGEFVRSERRSPEVRATWALVRRTTLRLIASVARVKAEIVVDVNRGLVPNSVRSFAKLHDYVDANEYLAPDFKRDRGDTTFCNAVADVVHLWLKSGGLRAAKETR